VRRIGFVDSLVPIIVHCTQAHGVQAQNFARKGQSEEVSMPWIAIWVTVLSRSFQKVYVLLDVTLPS